jgi:hypothetical protein
LSFRTEQLTQSVILHGGDCLTVLASMGENSIDSCVTDPPYHLTSIVKRFGAANAAPAKSGKTGAYARASAGFMGEHSISMDAALGLVIPAKLSLAAKTIFRTKMMHGLRKV